MVIGICIGETSLTHVTFISDKMPNVGEYVTMEYNGKKVLGMIENLIMGNDSLNVDINDFKAIQKISRIGAEENYIKGKVKILGDVNDNLKLPRTPVLPGTEIKLADNEVLDEIFKVKNPIKLGCLVNQSDVEVNVEANPILSRHLAILAMTGAGKSNTVSVLIDQFLRYNLPIFVFDMHGEYKDAVFPNGEVNVIRPKINPHYMSFHEIKKLVNIGANSYIQERHFRRAFHEAKESLKNGVAQTNNFLQVMYDILENKSLEEGSDKQIVDVMNKIDDAMIKYSNIFDKNIGNILSSIKKGHANVLDLSQVDESVASVLVSHILRNALQRSKDAASKGENLIENSVFFILEEAHILAPKKRETDSKKWIQRVAREGRKFGLGLCLVSQSPKTVDHDALSQMNNMIILRLVEPEDQRHVQSASESLSKDLVDQLPSLNVGEAIVLGLMSKVPTLVKIDRFKGRRHGDDMDIISHFKNSIQKEKEEIENAQQETLDMGYDY
ncbi:MULTISPECIES: ATP-binding protein [Methanobrevibacter]|uniref:helicase HerA-like domain-containing protein n=1 Tax=Methanobrevibacter TaxID=2172 RepID=UPI0025DC5DED|nr:MULTISPECIES: ATP-binding protein [Methanobrevibacter]MBS7258296.1 ATP-binding protein [Methanobrevibacter sp.]MCI7428655.1 ATP-binding protein [Methanobrevibacter sp.]MDD6777265.1 ATP-binding protein [Methanobacteriaceae archaeon]MDY3097372.1 ATP-binding protein [Methanobrevibacter sp.]